MGKKPQTQTFVLQYQSLTVCFYIDHVESAIAGLIVVSLGTLPPSLYEEISSCQCSEEKFSFTWIGLYFAFWNSVNHGVLGFDSESWEKTSDSDFCIAISKSNRLL